MIQVLGLRDRADANTKKIKKAHAFFNKGWRFETIQDVFNAEKRAALLAQIPEKERYNLYFTVADCFEEQARKLKEQWVVPFDIDDIQITSEATAFADATAVFQEACRSLGVDPELTGGIFSGHGVQLFVGIDRAIRSEEFFDQGREYYGAISKKLQSDLNACGVIGKVDTSVWSTARLMRLPDTLNVKPGKIQRVARVINSVVALTDYDLRERSGVESFKQAETLAPQAMRHYPAPDTGAVLEGCEFIKWAGNNQEKVQEPQWYALLSVLSRLNNGADLCHSYSEKHPDYSFEETEIKIEQAKNAAGPRTCKDIESRWDGCTTCAFYQKCASPILIRGPDYLRSKDFGFRHIIINKEGITKEGKPHYQDLVKYFGQQTPFITLDSFQLMTYNGTHWVPMKDAYINEWCMRTVRSEPTASEMQEFRLVLMAHNVRSAEDMARTSDGKLNFKNCVLDLMTGEVTPHKPEYGFTYMLPFNYDPQAKAPRWEQFLKEITADDPELIQCLKEFGGYAISGDDCWVQKGLFLLGEGANGKSVYAETLMALVGPKNCSAIPLQDLKSEYARYDLYGKLFNVSGETSTAALYESEAFKALVSGDTIRGRQPHGRPLEFKNRAKVINLGNNPPSSKDKSYGFERRFLIVPFNVIFTEDDPRRDPLLVEKLREEIAGICNSLMAAYKKARERRMMINPAASKKELEKLMKDSNTVKLFFDERVEVEPRASSESVPKDELFQAYVMFCRDNEERPLPSVHFWRQVRKIIPDFEQREYRSDSSGGRKRMIAGVIMERNL